MNPNESFNDAATGLSKKERYLLRMAPDFGAIDIAEKYCLSAKKPDDNNQDAHYYNGIFYYNEDLASSQAIMTLARVLLCSNDQLNFDNSEKNTDDTFILEEFHSGGKYYYILVNQYRRYRQSIKISAANSTGKVQYLIGVGF